MGRANSPKVAVLLSGGMDSIALAYRQRPGLAIHLDYGQRPAEAELTAARVIAHRLGIELVEVSADLRTLGSGDLHGTPALSVAPVSEWWPFRNQALVTLAAMSLISRGVEVLGLGTVASDRIHRDGSADFVNGVSDLLAMQEGGMSVDAPFISLSSVEAIREASVPVSLLAWAHSCHTANVACGRCRGCAKQREVWAELEHA